MVRLSRNGEPTSLAQNKATWTAQLLSYIKRGEPIPETLKRNYNQDDVKATLREDSHGKCMYCESPIGHITYAHIEHIKPKARDKYPELTFEWENLGLACPKCNMNKDDNYNEALPFINPYIEDPADFLVAMGAFIYHRAGNQRGEITEKTIELNRSELVERRKERIEMIRNLADKLTATDNAELKEILEEEIEEEINKHNPYSMCAKSEYKSLL